ncbi:hypothetical protein SAMN05660477_02345 [Soonwooa buanensis]|uniref:Uncharacterized protein n=1 Tax=Soonwooa buanensis TaxID=619805 RepID=A0A1T5FVN8_9FLAO|nr:hypothetical protein [Soonwooa buanensis]SKC00239.1 hypothetical protein SAMN05660477_02345 [Soonwooa buanensis]
MKTFILCLLLFLCNTNFQAQEGKQDSLSQASNTYLTKSIRKKKMANIIALSGAGLATVGTFLLVSGHPSGLFFSESQIIGINMITGGALAAIASIPFYIISYINKRKSLKISPSISFQKPILVQENFAQAGVLIQF